MIFSEVICTELAFRLTTTWYAQPFYVPVPATGKTGELVANKSLEGRRRKRASQLKR